MTTAVRDYAMRLILLVPLLAGCCSTTEISLIGNWKNRSKVLNVPPGKLSLCIENDSKGALEFDEGLYGDHWKTFSYRIKKFRNLKNEGIVFVYPIESINIEYYHFKIEDSVLTVSPEAREPWVFSK